MGDSSPTGWLRIGQALLGGVINPIANIGDAFTDTIGGMYQRQLQQRVAEGMFNRSNAAYDERKQFADTEYANSLGEIDRNVLDQMNNINRYWSDYAGRGGMTGQASTQLADVWNRTSPWLAHMQKQSGDIWNAGERLMGEQYANAEAARRQYERVQEGFNENRNEYQRQMGEYERNRQAVIDNTDLAGQQRRDEAMLDEVRNIRGGQMVSSKVGGLLAEKNAALQALDPNDPEYATKRNAISRQYDRQARDEVQAVHEQLTGLLTTTYSAMQNNMTNLRTQLNESLVGLQDTATKAYGHFTDAYGNMVSGSRDALQLVNDSLNGVSSTIKGVLGESARLTESGMQTVSQLATNGLATMWDAIKADEKVRAFAAVDGPNAVLDMASQRRLENNATYTSTMLLASDSRDQWLSTLGSALWSWTPNSVHMSDYVNNMMGGMGQAFQTSLAYDDWHAQQHWNRIQSEQNWFSSIASLGLGATNTALTGAYLGGAFDSGNPVTQVSGGSRLPSISEQMANYQYTGS